MRFSSCIRCKLLFGSQPTQCSKGSDSFRLQATVAFVRLKTLLGRPLCRFAVSARWKWQKVLFRSIEHCSLGCLCCWARRWMLQDMDNVEARCVFYVKVSTFTHLEQRKTSLLTVNKSGIVRLTVQHDLIVGISFMYYRRDSSRQTSAHVLFFEHCPIYSWQSSDFSCRTPQCMPVNTQTTTDQHIAHHGAVGNPCNV